MCDDGRRRTVVGIVGVGRDQVDIGGRCHQRNRAPVGVVAAIGNLLSRGAGLDRRDAQVGEGLIDESSASIRHRGVRLYRWWGSIKTRPSARATIRDEGCEQEWAIRDPRIRIRSRSDIE